MIYMDKIPYYGLNNVSNKNSQLGFGTNWKKTVDNELKQGFFERKGKKIGHAIDVPVNKAKIIFKKLFSTETVKKSDKQNLISEHPQTVIKNIDPPIGNKKEIAFPEPQFSFDHGKLEKDLTGIEQVTPEWIEGNPKSMANILKACENSIKDKDFLKGDFDYNTQAKIINTGLLNKNAKNGFLQTAKEQYAKEKKEYVDSIIPYAEHTDKNLNIKALNAIEKYGTSEHLDIIGGNFVSTTDEELIKPFVKTVMAVGKPVEHSYYLFGWLQNPKNKLSTETYKDIFKGIEKIGVHPGLYKYLPKVFNKVSTSQDDELAKALTDTLCKVSTKEHIPELQKYAESENPVVRESIAKIIKTVGHKS